MAIGRYAGKQIPHESVIRISLTEISKLFSPWDSVSSRVELPWDKEPDCAHTLVLYHGDTQEAQSSTEINL